MCGIVGAYSPDFKVDQNLIKAMTNVLHHRGPDSEGYYFENNVGLGHRRLKIIDLSDRGDQPMFNEDDSIVIVFNGEIYNYIEIRELLIKRGHQFKSETDTEVIIHCYEEYGYNCLSHLNGMFSFAIWDKNKRILFCARDRFGIKPFYYFKDKRNFIFSSEIKAFLKYENFAAEVNQRMLYHYLFYGKMDHTHETFFKNVYQLPQSSYMLVGEDGVVKHQYFKLEKNGEIISDKKAFLFLLQDSIKLMLRSDVPVGLLLSGGVDSTSIACIIDDLRQKGFQSKNFMDQTFSAGSTLPEYDESRYVKIVSQKVKARTNIIYPDGKDLIATLSKIIWFHDEPIPGTSIFAHWHLMELAKKNAIKVLLIGQGADEILCGYKPYHYYYLAELIKNMRLKRFLKEMNLHSDQYSLSKSFVVRFTLQKFFTEIFNFKLAAVVNRYDNYFNLDIDKDEKIFYEYRDGRDLVSTKSYNDIFYTNLPYILHYEDRNSMAWSIESRVPFLDHRLVEMAYAMPTSLKVDGVNRKIMLRNAVQNIIPDEIRCRVDKMAFTTPMHKWLAEDAKQDINDIFNSSLFRSRGFFNISTINNAYEKYCQGDLKYKEIVWRSLSVELWMRAFMDRGELMIQSSS